MPQLENVDVVAEGLLFPEGPVALPDGSVLVVEIRSGNVVRVAADGSKDTVASPGGGPNGAAIGPDGTLYVCNNGGFANNRIDPCIQRVDLDTGETKVLYGSCGDRPLRGPNDLVFDTAGNFYVTDHTAEGSVYYASPDGSRIERVVDSTSWPNGVGISPDGSTLYWAETHTRQVWRRRITAPGQLEPSNGYTVRSLFRPGGLDRFTLLAGLPNCHELDSLAIDSSGAVVVGTLVDAGVSEISPDGEWTLHTLPKALHDHAVTNVCFGGSDLRTMYITCSTTGRLLRATWHRPGLRLNY